MKFLKEYFAALFDVKLMPTALKVAVVVSSILLIINHGSALIKGKMNQESLISAFLTYLVPYAVNIHGQYISQKRHR